MEPLIDAVFVTSINSGISTVQVYDTSTGSNIKSYNGAIVSPSSLNFVGRSEYLLSGQKDKPLLQAWLLNKAEPLQVKMTVPGRVSLVEVSSCGPLYCAIGIGENIFLYKLASGRLLGVLKQHYQPVTCLRFSPCGNYLISGGEDGLLVRWNVIHILDSILSTDVPESHFKLAQHSDQVTDIATTPGLHCNVISTSLDCTANIYDLHSGQLRHKIIVSEGLARVTTNSLGTHCFLADVKGFIWNKKLLPHIPEGTGTLDEDVKCKCHEGKITCLSMTSSGDQLVTGGEDSYVKIWKVINTKTGGSLALQRSVHKDRGVVTNVKVLRMEREIFTAADLSPIEVISPITSTVATSNDHFITINVGPRYDIDTPLTNTNGIKTTKGDSSNKELDELKSNIETLKGTNKQLFNYIINKLL